MTSGIMWHDLNPDCLNKFYDFYMTAIDGFICRHDLTIADHFICLCKVRNHRLHTKLCMEMITLTALSGISSTVGPSGAHPPLTFSLLNVIIK